MTHIQLPKTLYEMLLGFSLALSTPVLGLSQKHAYVRRDALLAVLPGYTTKMKVQDSLKTAYTYELDTYRKTLRQKMGALLSPYSRRPHEPAEMLRQRLSPAEAARYRLLLGGLRQLNTKREGYEHMLHKHYQHAVQPLLDRLNQHIRRYAAKKNYDMVFILEDIGPSLAYINMGKDITPAIIPLIKNSSR